MLLRAKFVIPGAECITESSFQKIVFIVRNLEKICNIEGLRDINRLLNTPSNLAPNMGITKAK